MVHLLVRASRAHRVGRQARSRSNEVSEARGWVVPTTEYSVSSNTTTINSGNLVLFRRCNIKPIADRLRADGTLPGDLMVDVPPYKEQIHLKLLIGSTVATSIGLIIQKAG